MPTPLERTREIPRIDLRRNRVIPLIHAILEKARPKLRDERDLRDLHDDIGQMLFEAGAEIITDHLRSTFGLPPRGPDGWTGEELAALERSRLALISAPIRAPADFPFPPDLGAAEPIVKAPRSTVSKRDRAAMSDRKYVILRNGETGKEYAVIFDRDLAHKSVAEGVAREMRRTEWGPRMFLEPVAAGFVGDPVRSSESLKLGPRPGDSALLGLNTPAAERLAASHKPTDNRSLLDKARGAKGRRLRY